MSDKEIPIVNPVDADTRGRHGAGPLFRMWASTGGYAPAIQGYVWARSFDDAFEIWIEWLDDNAPGCLTDLKPADYKEAAEELGLAWQSHWPDWDDKKWEKVAQHAEMDLTQIGHTTLKHGQFIESENWGGDDVTDKKEFDAVYAASMIANEED